MGTFEPEVGPIYWFYGGIDAKAEVIADYAEKKGMKPLHTLLNLERAEAYAAISGSSNREERWTSAVVLLGFRNPRFNWHQVGGSHRVRTVRDEPIRARESRLSRDTLAFGRRARRSTRSTGSMHGHEEAAGGVVGGSSRSEPIRAVSRTRGCIASASEGAQMQAVTVGQTSRGIRLGNKKRSSRTPSSTGSSPAAKRFKPNHDGDDGALSDDLAGGGTDDGGDGESPMPAARARDRGATTHTALAAENYALKLEVEALRRKVTERDGTISSLEQRLKQLLEEKQQLIAVRDASDADARRYAKGLSDLAVAFERAAQQQQQVDTQ